MHNWGDMNRKPPSDVRRTLRHEVGFGCPVPDCGSPYLEWHHFDPPWRVREHHEPDGMIALCSEHHPKADAGAFTVKQLRAFKLNGATKREEISGRFDWLRNRLLLVAGSCFFYETLIILEFRGTPIIWLRRDEDGYLLLNLRMLTTSKQQRLWLEDNYWIEKGTPTDFECPPSGKLIHAMYENGDEIRIEFFELSALEEAQRHYPSAHAEYWRIQFPITIVEVLKKVGGTDISFGPNWTMLGGNQLKNFFFSHNHCGISIN